MNNKITKHKTVLGFLFGVVTIDKVSVKNNIPRFSHHKKITKSVDLVKDTAESGRLLAELFLPSPVSASYTLTWVEMRTQFVQSKTHAS